jgi:hypothetical protein
MATANLLMADGEVRGKDMTRSPEELARRWRERAAELGWEAAYHLRFAADELDSLGIREEQYS